MTSEPYCGRRWDRGDGARVTSRTADMPALLWIRAIVPAIVPVAFICYKSIGMDTPRQRCILDI
jgi:hypothetical protein